jgi:monooxygenase
VEQLDVLIVGAGISGIGAAHHLKERCPDRSFAILEGRERLGGTWDLFRYPGIRSDSDMFTLGFNFRPWTEAKAIADGPSILKYLDETVAEDGTAGAIRYRHKVVAADWDSAASRWTVRYEADGVPGALTASFLYLGAGYYRYDRGHRPHFPQEEQFTGQIVHPQFWPQDLDYTDRQVVVIGSGATAMTLVPAMATTAAKVTMLQRSPTWVVSRPAEDAVANVLRKVLPAKLAYGLIRWRNVLFQMYFYGLTRKAPAKVRQRLLELAAAELPPGFDIKKHFTPRYNPWDQRLCLVPDADLFQAIKRGDAEVVTDTITRFTPGGIELSDGRELKADIIVTATGLELQSLGGIDISLDGKALQVQDTFSYKGIMYSGVPNLMSVFGYTNASWTLKADLTAEYLCRLLNHMRDNGTRVAMPREAPADLPSRPWLDFTSGYVVRALDRFPRQGVAEPWLVHQNYIKDIKAMRRARLDDGVMAFS